MPYRPSSNGARRMACPGCGESVLRQLVGQRAALDVTADAKEMAASDAAALRTDDRLDWCVRKTRDGVDLRWAHCTSGGRSCDHPHVIDHVCTAPKTAARPARSRTRKPTPVPAGQLTLA